VGLVTAFVSYYLLSQIFPVRQETPQAVPVRSM
jgi:hypothetical protein